MRLAPPAGLAMPLFSAMKAVPRRPRPPAGLQSEPKRGQRGRFVPAPELAEWLTAVYLDKGSKLYSETHADIIPARIGVVWTSHVNRRGDSLICGDASLAMAPRALSGWNSAMHRWQLAEWFGSWWGGLAADFLIRIYAPYFAAADDVDALALGKHELLHCRHSVNRHGSKRYSQGRPVWGIRRHDVEEFSEVIECFGPDVGDGSVRRMLDAAARSPKIARATIAAARGTCRRVA